MAGEPGASGGGNPPPESGVSTIGISPPDPYRGEQTGNATGRRCGHECDRERGALEVDGADRRGRASAAGDGDSDDGLRRPPDTPGPARVRDPRPAGLLGLGG